MSTLWGRMGIARGIHYFFLFLLKKIVGARWNRLKEVFKQGTHTATPFCRSLTFKFMRPLKAFYAAFNINLLKLYINLYLCECVYYDEGVKPKALS